MDALQGAAAAIAATFARMAACQVLADVRAEEPEVVAVVIECRHTNDGTDCTFEYRNGRGDALGGGTL